MTIGTHLKEPRLSLEAETAADLMSRNPISLRKGASVREAVALLTDRNIDAAPVIDEIGRAIGVVTVADVLVHDREYASYLKNNETIIDAANPRAVRGGEAVDRTRVEEIMTPTVFAVAVDTPSASVVRKMLDLGIHHLFVADGDGVLVGVISSGDILRRLV